MNISPLLVTVIAYFLLKEALSKINLVALFSAFAGVIIVCTKNTVSETFTVSNTEFYFGVMLVGITCFCTSGVAINLRILNAYCHYSIGPFYFAVVTCLEGLLLLLFFNSLFHYNEYTVFTTGLFMLSGALNYIAQIFKSLAYKYEKASVVTPFVYSQVVMLLLSDLAIFGYAFTASDVFGASLVIISLIAPILIKFYWPGSKAIPEKAVKK